MVAGLGGVAQADTGGDLVQAAVCLVFAPSLCSVSANVLRKLSAGFYIPLKGACPSCLEEVSTIMENGTREVPLPADALKDGGTSQPVPVRCASLRPLGLHVISRDRERARGPADGVVALPPLPPLQGFAAQRVPHVRAAAVLPRGCALRSVALAERRVGVRPHLRQAPRRRDGAVTAGLEFSRSLLQRAGGVVGISRVIMQAS
jgi:hypothetical protein